MFFRITSQTTIEDLFFLIINNFIKYKNVFYYSSFRLGSLRNILSLHGLLFHALGANAIDSVLFGGGGVP